MQTHIQKPFAAFMSGGAYTRIISNLVAERGSISKSAEEGLAAGDGDDKDIDSREVGVHFLKSKR